MSRRLDDDAPRLSRRASSRAFQRAPTHRPRRARTRRPSQASSVQSPKSVQPPQHAGIVVFSLQASVRDSPRAQKARQPHRGRRDRAPSSTPRARASARTRQTCLSLSLALSRVSRARRTLTEPAFASRVRDACMHTHTHHGGPTTMDTQKSSATSSYTHTHTHMVVSHTSRTVHTVIARRS